MISFLPVSQDKAFLISISSPPWDHKLTVQYFMYFSKNHKERHKDISYLLVSNKHEKSYRNHYTQFTKVLYHLLTKAFLLFNLSSFLYIYIWYICTLKYMCILCKTSVIMLSNQPLSHN